MTENDPQAAAAAAAAAAEKTTAALLNRAELDDIRDRSVDRRLNDLSADAGMMRKNIESIHVEMRDIRTQSTTTQQWVEDNSRVTREVRDIVASFHVIGAFAKWITTVAAAIALVWAITKGWFQHK